MQTSCLTCCLKANCKDPGLNPASSDCRGLRSALSSEPMLMSKQYLQQLKLNASLHVRKRAYVRIWCNGHIILHTSFV